MCTLQACPLPHIQGRSKLIRALQPLRSAGPICNTKCESLALCYKLRQGARNEIEKLKLSEMTARQAVMEVAKILHKVSYAVILGAIQEFTPLLHIVEFACLCRAIVPDERPAWKAANSCDQILL